MSRLPCARLAPAVFVVVFLAAPALAQDPARTPTIYVHGFEDSGADRRSVFGVDLRVPEMDSIAALAGLPVADSGAASLPANVVTATDYYGSTPPASWTTADVAALDSVTARWGGGVPRYAVIVAHYIRDVLRRSHTDRVNVVSASFGSLIVRWMIEKDVGGIASEARVARWLSIEGILDGNWAASRGDLIRDLDLVDPQPIDVTHMSDAWIETNLHTPRGEADDPHYGGILIGEMASTDDGYEHAALSDLMRTYDVFQPNDGVQAVADALFSTVTPRSRFLGRVPTIEYFPTDHLSLKNFRGAWAATACFVTQRRRVTVTFVTARVSDLHEPELPFWDWRPAEVVFENRVTSPRVASRWGITDPLSTRTKASAAAPLYRYAHDGDSQEIDQVLFDGFVPDDETRLHLDLQGEEVDYDWRYGVYETAQLPYFDDLGSTSIDVSTLAAGTDAVSAASWSGTLRVDVVDYPFTTTSVPPSAAPAERGALRFAPNPHAGAVTVSLGGLAAGAGSATLDVFDTSGRRVRRLTGDPARGIRWDGRDDQGRAAPAGVYLYRLSGAGTPRAGRSLLLR